MSAAMEQIRFWSPWLLSHWFWPMLWQSSLLIGVLFIIDLALKQKLRPAVRYALWLVLLVKLILPPSLALPTGLGWWLRPREAASAKPHTTTVTVSYGPSVVPEPITHVPTATVTPPPPPLPAAAWALLGSSLASVGLLVWMMFRWAQVGRTARCATAAPDWLSDLLAQTKAHVGIRRGIRLKLIAEPMSPAACGFFRPVILLPRALTNLPEGRLRTVLLHELIHLRRGDVWVNCGQALLQILYWWHPLLWLANSRIRRLREEAVDDAVMVALHDDAPDYAPTLVEVARLALQRPLTSLGLVGILESKTALRHRIERLVDFRAPRRAGLTFASVLGLSLFTAIAVPMGEAPATPQRSSDAASAQMSLWPDPRFEGYSEVRLEPEFLIADEANLRPVIPVLLDSQSPLVLSSNEVANLDMMLRQANAQPVPAGEPLNFAKFSGGQFLWHVGGTTNNTVNYHTREVGSRTVVTGGEVGLATTLPEWVPIDFGVVPWTDGNQLRCELQLVFSSSDQAVQQAAIVLPEHGATVWAKPIGTFSGKYEVVVLRRDSAPSPLQQGPSAAILSAANSQLAPASSTNNQAPATAALERFLKAQTKVQDGKLLFEMGKLDEAEASLSQALVLNPQSQAAQYYLKLVREALFQTNTLSLMSGTNQPLYTRSFKVDPMAFEERVNALPPLDITSHPWISEPSVRTLSPDRAYLARVPLFFQSIGVDLNPPKSVFYKDLDGRLYVRATLQDLNTIEAALQDLSYSAPTYVELYTRIIKVDPTTFLEGLRAATGGHASPKDPAELQKTLVKFFTSAGAEINPPKSIFFNDREGTLVIRASLQDLNAIEQAVQVLNITPPQIHFGAKFIAVPIELMTQLQLEVPLYVPGHDNVVLSAAQRQVLLKALQSNKDVEVLGESSVTTLSGRQAEIQIVSESSGASGISDQPLPPWIVAEPRLTNQTPSIQLDIVGYAGADKPTIQISGKSSATEFLGYNSPDPLKPTNWDTRLLKGDAVITGQPNSLLPRFRIHEHTFNSKIGDGQTLVLGNAAPNTSRPNMVAGPPAKSLLVLITPTLIDPAGNRVYSEEKLQR